MKFRNFKFLNIILLFFTFLGFNKFLFIINPLNSEQIIKWKRIENKTKENTQNWYKLSKDKEEIYLNPIQENIYKENLSSFSNEDKRSTSIVEIDPHFPTTSFLKKGLFSSTFQWKSSFSTGESGGIGQQNNSYKFNYGLTDSLLFTGYFAEADDHLFKKIKNRKYRTPYAWQTFAVSLKKNILDTNKFDFALNSSIEYWKVSSGESYTESIYSKNNALGKTTFHNLVGSISVPIKYKKSDDLVFYLLPGISFLPKKQGSEIYYKNSYGNNFYLGTGFIYDLSEKLSFLSSYTYPLGPGDNYFNNNLDYSKKPIYSFGLNYEASPKIELEAKLTNSFGGTPSTGILTIPSSNELLYYGGLKVNHKNQDITLIPLLKKEERLKFGGLTVSNAYLPDKGVREINIEYDSKGSLFSSYRYSISNIFQMELINIGRFKDIKERTEIYNDTKSTFLSDGNTNYRIGGKMIFLSPLKNDPIWLSGRITVGRNDTNNQGYLFSEIINTFNLNEKLAISLSPKFTFSGVENISGIGFGLNYALNNKVDILPEVNINFSNKEEINSTLAIRYKFNANRSFDLYLSNAAGLQDIGQLIKSDELRTGFKIHFFY